MAGNTRSARQVRRSLSDTTKSASGKQDVKLCAAEKQVKKLSMLLNVSRRVSNIESLDEILETIVEMISKEVNAERGTLFLNDPISGELYSRVAQGDIHREIRLLNTTGIAGHVFTTCEGVYIEDAYADPRFERTIDEKTGFKTKSICCAPVLTAVHS